MKEILFQFGLDAADFNVQPFGNGLINTTWMVEGKLNDQRYILQKINHHVFKHPEDIAHNTRLIDAHFKKNFPAYLFVSPCITITGNDLVKMGESYYRMFPF